MNRRLAQDHKTLVLDEVNNTYVGGIGRVSYTNRFPVFISKITNDKTRLMRLGFMMRFPNGHSNTANFVNTINNPSEQMNTSHSLCSYDISQP